jgi:hypothetical protein
MGLAHEEEQALATAHTVLVQSVRPRGFDLDYSIDSLGEVERLLDVFRRAQANGRDYRGLVWPVSAYVAEVLRRAVPGAWLASEDGELTVTLPSRLVPGGTLKLMPAVRVAKLLEYEETLLLWAICSMGLAGHGELGESAMPGLAAREES